MDTLREVTLLAVFLRIFSAMLVGGLIGLERGLKRRAAGMRTYMLVCVGSCLIMLTNQYIFQITQAGDPMRMGAQVVSGIGFLGAGTIIVTKYNQIKGLTTAAGLWAAAGVGLALGIGFYEAALVGGAAIALILIVLYWLDRKVYKGSKTLDLHIVLGAELSLDDLMRSVTDMDMTLETLQLEYDSTLGNNVRALDAVLKMDKRQDHAAMLERLRGTPGILHLEEI